MKYPPKVALKYRGFVAVERKAHNGIVFDVKKNVDSITLSTESSVEQARAAIDFVIANPTMWA